MGIDLFNASTIDRLFAEAGIQATDRQLAAFCSYADFLLEYNKKINLTAITEPREVIVKHFIDSLTLLPLIGAGAGSLIDIGAGAGFPGIPVKIMRPDIRITLMDARNKKIRFLIETADLLKLKGVECIHERAENPGGLAGKFDCAAARAVADLKTLAGYCLPYVRAGGVFYALKGAGADNELRDAKGAIQKNGGTVSDIRRVTLPDGYARAIIAVRKR